MSLRAFRSRPKLATLTVFIDVAPNVEPTVTIDGHPIPAALLGARRPTDPGDHLIIASAPGYLSSSRHVILGPGEETSAALALVIDASAPARAKAEVTERRLPAP